MKRKPSSYSVQKPSHLTLKEGLWIRNVRWKPRREADKSGDIRVGRKRRITGRYCDRRIHGTAFKASIMNSWLSTRLTPSGYEAAAWLGAKENLRRKSYPSIANSTLSNYSGENKLKTMIARVGICERLEFKQRSVQQLTWTIPRSKGRDLYNFKGVLIRFLRWYIASFQPLAVTELIEEQVACKTHLRKPRIYARSTPLGWRRTLTWSEMITL